MENEGRREKEEGKEKRKDGRKVVDKEEIGKRNA